MSAVTFVASPPGLAPLTEFGFEEVDGADGLYTLVASGDPDVRLFVIDAPVYLPDYSPSLSAEQLASVGASELGDVRLLVVATLQESGPAANLMAPILVNESNGEAAQVILDGDDWPLRMSLTA